MSAPAWIPLGDAASLGSRARTVRRWRVGLMTFVVALVVFVFVATLGLRPTPAVPLSDAGAGLVVLDISASISSDTYARISSTLDRLVGSNGEYGLVLFSDTAYQALPPGTPARELRPFARFFDVRPRESPGAFPELPHSPWTDSFSAGTRISTGLQLALDVIRERRLEEPAVMLVSDLDDDTGDLPRLGRVALAYRQAGIPLHVVGLNPSPEDVAFIRRLVPANGSFERAALPGADGRAVEGDRDTSLFVAAALVAFALAALLVVVHRPVWSVPA